MQRQSLPGSYPGFVQVQRLRVAVRPHGCCGESLKADHPTRCGVGTVDGLLGQEAYSTDGVTLDHYPYPQMRLYVKKITESYQHYSEIYK